MKSTKVLTMGYFVRHNYGKRIFLKSFSDSESGVNDTKAIYWSNIGRKVIKDAILESSIEVFNFTIPKWFLKGLGWRTQRLRGKITYSTSSNNVLGIINEFKIRRR